MPHLCVLWGNGTIWDPTTESWLWSQCIKIHQAFWSISNQWSPVAAGSHLFADEKGRDFLAFREYPIPEMDEGIREGNVFCTRCTSSNNVLYMCILIHIYVFISSWIWAETSAVHFCPPCFPFAAAPFGRPEETPSHRWNCPDVLVTNAGGAPWTCSGICGGARSLDALGGNRMGMGISWEYLGNILGIFWEYFGNILGI